MNSELDLLQPYPFEKLRALKEAVQAPDGLTHIALSIGEPKHAPPALVKEALVDNLALLSNYPATAGMHELREYITKWASKRFRLNSDSLESKQVLPVNGTREALFAFAQAVVQRPAEGQAKPLVISPNPFYQIYEGAALLAGAMPHYLPCLEGMGFIPDFSTVEAEVWQRCQLLYLCSPGNPTGAITSSQQLQKLIALADQYDFIIASDECYSEIYLDEHKPPIGLLQTCAELGRDDFRRCVVFNSLSKRSNLPGLRSGFVAGDADVITQFLLYRTYHGCAMPGHHQMASIAAWGDEQHVIDNRALYRIKFEAVLEALDGCLDVQKPEAGFFLWAKTAINDTDFAQQLFAYQNVTVLPGSYIARDGEDGCNPGANRIRMALVAPLAECLEAARRIKQFVEGL